MKFNAIKRSMIIHSLSATFLFLSLSYTPFSSARSLQSRVADNLFKNIGKIVSGATNRFGYLVDQALQKFSKLFNTSQAKSADKTTSAIGAATDAINSVMITIANKELEMESQPAPYARPSSGVATSNLFQAMQTLIDEIESVCTSTAQALQQLDLSVQAKNVKAFKSSIVKRFNEDEIVKDLDVSSILSPEGYMGEDAVDNSTYFIHFQMGDLYSLFNIDELETGSPLIVRFTTILHALKQIQGVRVRSKEMYEKFITAYPNSVLHSTEESILKETLQGEMYGLSINDCIDFEIFRRWKNSDWHDKLNGNISQTALTQEFVEQQAYNNFIRFLNHKMEEQINLLEGLMTIEYLDKNRRSKLQFQKDSVVY